MASITSAGIGSGLNVESIISSLMAAERTSLTKVTQERTAINTKVSIYGIIKSSFSDLKTATDKLTNLSNIYPLKASSSDDKLVSATATSASAKGSYNLEVSQLAKKQSIAAQAVASADTTVGTGSLTITLGAYNANTNVFTDKAGATPVTVNIGTGQQTLNGIKQAINDANAGVTASIVNDGTGARLVLTSKETGLENGFKVEVADSDATNTDLSGLSKLAFNPTATLGTGKNQSTLELAQNAEFTINNLAVTKSSNTVTDAVDGLTLNLKAETTGPVAINVGLDDTALKKTMDEFVSAYNKIRGNLKDQQEKDATLSKETTPSSLERGLRDILRQTVQAYNLSLTDVGMSFDKAGVLSLNKTKLDEALAKDPAVIEKLFANTGTTTDARVKYLGGSSATLNGTYAINVTQAYSAGVNAGGTLNGATATGTDNMLTGAVGNASEGLQVSVLEGVSGALGTVTFNKGMAKSLSSWIESLTAEGGALASRTEGLSGRLKRLDSTEEKLNLRFDQIEKRYRAQFTTLDGMLSSMQQTSAYLTQQLSALSNLK